MINCLPPACIPIRPSGLKALVKVTDKVSKITGIYWVGRDYRKVIRLLVSYLF